MKCRHEVSYLLYYNMLQHYRHRELPTAVSALSYMEPPLPAPPAFDRLAISCRYIPVLTQTAPPTATVSSSSAATTQPEPPASGWASCGAAVGGL
eukprot:COSAG04_NODE_209_length_20232_cov_116.817315_14_plen_95_part_00